MAKKVNEESTTGLTVSTPTPDLLAALDAKIASLKHIEETPYKTTGTFSTFSDVKSEMKIENLLRMAGSVIGMKESYDKGQKAVGLKAAPLFNINGGTQEDWISDIKLRIEIINHKETFDKLTAYKDKMSKFLSEADQKAMLLKEMDEFLNK